MGLSRERVGGGGSRILPAPSSPAKTSPGRPNPGDGAEGHYTGWPRPFEVSNPEWRAYDTYGHQVPRGGASSYPGGEPFGGFQDIFEAFFGDRSFGGSYFGAGARAPSRGADAEVEVEVALREAAFGVDRDVKVQTIKNCQVVRWDRGHRVARLPDVRWRWGSANRAGELPGSDGQHPAVLDLRRPREGHRRHLRQLSGERQESRRSKSGGCGFRLVSRAACGCEFPEGATRESLALLRATCT